MSGTYNPDPTNNPTSFTEPSDGDGPGIKAADVNPFLEGLADKLAYLIANFFKPDIEYNVVGSYNYVVPANVHYLLVWGYGGGGGGGAGLNGSGTATAVPCSGGGGGGSMPSWQLIAVVPGETLTIVVGDGGNGGATFGAPGLDGHECYISAVRPGPVTVILARFPGAQGGMGSPSLNTTPGSFWQSVYGGGPLASSANSPARLLLREQRTQYPDASDDGIPGFGGRGVTTSFPEVTRDGAQHPNGPIGGNGGTPGTTGGFGAGGGGGGGGAGGPGGVGGNGGNGGNGGGTAGGNATAGANAGAASGAGGGGGGAGGVGSSTSGTFGAGGKGGSGLIRIMRPAA